MKHEVRYTGKFEKSVYRITADALACQHNENCSRISVHIFSFRVYGFRNYAYVDLRVSCAQQKKVLLITEKQELNTRKRGEMLLTVCGRDVSKTKQGIGLSTVPELWKTRVVRTFDRVDQMRCFLKGILQFMLHRDPISEAVAPLMNYKH